MLGQGARLDTEKHRRSGQRHLLLLALAAMAIIVVPWILVDQAWHRTQKANERLDHAQQVGALLSRLQADIWDFEAAAVTLSHDVSTPVLDEAMALSSGFSATLDQLTGLLRDDPRQLMLLGQIKARLERRTELSHQLAALSADPERQRRLLTDLVGNNPLRPLVHQLQSIEASRLPEQQAESERRALREREIRVVALALQLGLLAVVMGLMWRQLRRRIEIERRLADAGEQARQVFHAVREPIALVDAGLKVVTCNPAYLEFVGGESGDRALWEDPVLGKRLLEVIARGRELWDYEHAMRDAHGIQHSLQINARRVRLSTVEGELALVTIADMTAQRAAQQKVEELNRQLEGKIEQISEVNRELEAFSYSVSHDLRAPLRHIAGFADKLRERLDDAADDKSRHYMDVIGRSARRMSQLIDDLLVYSRLGRAALRLQAVDMQSLVEDTRALLDANLQAEAQAGGQPPRRVEWAIAPLPMVMADENMMRQVWLNLLGNAVKYTANEPVARIRVEVQRTEEDGYLFTVSDNGAGFDMAYAGKLFGVFQRMHKESEFAGSGVGLASVRRVLARHGGRIWAEAAVGEGASFHFTLPAHRDGTEG